MADKAKKVVEEKLITPNNNVPFAYGSFCIETYPCQHAVEIDGALQPGLWCGRKIVKWHKDRGHPVPAHFRYLEDPQRLW